VIVKSQFGTEKTSKWVKEGVKKPGGGSEGPWWRPRMKIVIKTEKETSAIVYK